MYINIFLAIPLVEMRSIFLCHVYTKRPFSFLLLLLAVVARCCCSLLLLAVVASWSCCCRCSLLPLLNLLPFLARIVLCLVNVFVGGGVLLLLLLLFAFVFFLLVHLRFVVLCVIHSIFCLFQRGFFPLHYFRCVSIYLTHQRQPARARCYQCCMQFSIAKNH